MNIHCPSCGVEIDFPDETESSIAEFSCSECGSPLVEQPPETENTIPPPENKTQQSKVLLWMGALLFLLFGVITLAISAQNSGTRDATSQPPQAMTLSELAEKGPGENLYVKLSDLQFGEEFVYNEATGKVWKDTWAFLFAQGDKSKPLAIAQLREGGQKGMMESMKKRTLQGLVSKKPKVFKATVGKKLYEAQGVEPGNAFYIIKELNQSPSQEGINLAFYIGIFLLGLGVVFIILAVTRKS